LEASGFTQCGVAQADKSHANNGNRNLTGYLMQHDRSERRAGVPMRPRGQTAYLDRLCMIYEER